jgi:predicted ATPase
LRLERFTIGGVGSGADQHFKNLKDVEIDFASEHWITVCIGWNGTGKSNILEALAIIFRELISTKPPAIPFTFSLTYRIGQGAHGRRIAIEQRFIGEQPRLDITTSQLNETEGSTQTPQQVNIKAFRSDARNLPRYVFSYYSGEGTRLQDVFRPYLERYDRDLRSGKDPGFKRLFYATPAHSQFVLLAFLIHQDPDVRKFLLEHLGIDPDVGIESVLFVLRQPPWNSTATDGDSRFWYARGVVQAFLDRLQTAALAPVQVSASVPVSAWNKRNLGFKYLFLPNIEALRTLVGNQSSAQFFRDLESTYVSQLIDEVRIRVRLSKSTESVTFRELSEGEQQLLTVLGLLRFTAEEESLFLLDEPDTHLNPRWSVDYLKYLKLFLPGGADEDQSCHVVMTTHNPIAIAGLEREQVQVLRSTSDGRTVAHHPALAPRGMGYAGVVTSDMFGLGSSLDRDTSDDLLELHQLANRSDLSPNDKEHLRALRNQLADLDFNFAARDRIEQEFRRARFDLVNDEPRLSGDNEPEPIVSPENKARALRALVSGLLASDPDQEV